MPATRTNVGGISYKDEIVTVVSASPYLEDHVCLKRILDDGSWFVERARTLADVRSLLLKNPSVILCERELPDGTWKDLLGDLRRSDAPLLVVISGQADEMLWAEVLNLGGYDVLMKPFDCAEVTRVLGMACRQWKRSHAAPPPELPYAAPLLATP